MSKSIINFIIVFLSIVVLASCGNKGGGNKSNVSGGQINGYNTNLSDIEVSEGLLSPLFSQTVTSYNIEVENGITDIDISVETIDSSAIVSIGSTNYNDNEATQNVSLSVGINTVIITVMAPDNETYKTYTISINRLAPVLSNNANLAGIELSEGTLSPVFAENTISYAVQVPYTVSAITVTPTVAGVDATVKVNNNTVTSGDASNSINLSTGTNTITVDVIAQDGTTSKTYTIVVTKLTEPSHNANLSNLSLATGTLSPGYAENTISYTAEVPYTVSAITVTPTVAGVGATVKVNNVAVTSGNASNSINLSTGTNTITVDVIAQDGTTSKTYTIVVTKLTEPSHNANLSELSLSLGTLSPVFAENTISYTSEVAYTVSAITVTPTVAGVGATVKVNNVAVTSGSSSSAITLISGTNTITINVLAQDETTNKTYTIIINKLFEPSHDASLTNLSLSSGSTYPIFNPNTTSYTAQVGCPISVITVTPTVAGVGATVKVNNVDAVSGISSGDISLTEESNIITIDVLAQDGITSKTYTIVVSIISPQWAKTVYSGATASSFDSVCVDTKGNIYVVGEIFGTEISDFGNGVTVQGVSYNSNLVLIKYNALGVAQWAKTVYSGTKTSYFISVAIDSSDNIYAVGYIEGNEEFDFGDGVTATGSYSDGWNLVLVKYNSNGITQWARTTTSGSNISFLNSVSVDHNGDVYAVGYINDSTEFNFGNNVIAKGISSIYSIDTNFIIIKYSSSGTAKWARTLISGSSFSGFCAVSIDNNDNVYAAGYIDGTGVYNFGNNVTVSGSYQSSGTSGATSRNLVLVKYDTSGSAQWARSLNKSSYESSYQSITTDSQGNICSASMKTGKN